MGAFTNYVLAMQGVRQGGAGGDDHVARRAGNLRRGERYERGALKVYTQRDRAAQARTIGGNGNEPRWSHVQTRDEQTGDIIEDVHIEQQDGESDRRWVFDLPSDMKGHRHLVTEFLYIPSDDAQISEIKVGQWKRAMGDLRGQFPEQVKFPGDGAVVSEYSNKVSADDLAEVFSPPRVLQGKTLRGDLAPGLKTRWSCCKEENRGWIYKEIERRKPKVRTVFSALQRYLSE